MKKPKKSWAEVQAELKDALTTTDFAPELQAVRV